MFNHSLDLCKENEMHGLDLRAWGPKYLGHVCRLCYMEGYQKETIKEGGRAFYKPRLIMDFLHMF